MLTRGLFWCLFPELQSNEGNKYQNNTWVSTETDCHESIYIILFLTQHNKSITDDKMTIFTNRPCVSLAQFSICWWCHNRLLMTSQWLDNCDAITWIMISNSLYIDFIHAIFTAGHVRTWKYWNTSIVQTKSYWIMHYHSIQCHEFKVNLFHLTKIENIRWVHMYSVMIF